MRDFFKIWKSGREIRSRLPEIEGVRALCFILIFIHHLYAKDAGPISVHGASYAVTVFFILSGYCLCLKYGDGKDCPSYGRYIWSRVIKLWPLSILCTAFVLIFQHENFSPGQMRAFLPQFFLVQSWIPIKEIYFGANSPAWFLSSLMPFYFLFPVLLKWLDSRPRTFIATTFSLISVLSVAAFGVGVEYEKELFYFLYVFPPVRILECMAGMALWKLLKNISILNPIKCDLIWLSAIALMMAYCYGTEMMATGVNNGLPVILAALATVFASVEAVSGVFAKLLRIKSLQFIGSVSLAAYLLHMPVINYSEYELGFYFGISRESIWIGITAFVFTLALAWLATRLFVKPMIRIGLMRRFNINAPVEN